LSISINDLGIDRLTVREKLDLIQQIWDSLPVELSPEEIPDWHLETLSRRRAEADPSPGLGKPWREAIARFGVDS